MLTYGKNNNIIIIVIDRVCIMRKDGFTIIEILGVLIILGLLAVISVPAVARVINNSNEELYKVQIENIKTGAKNWAVKNASILPSEEGESVTITLGQLKLSGDVVVDIKNPITKELFPNDMEIEIKRYLNNYIYLVNEDSGTDNGNFDPSQIMPTLVLVGSSTVYVEVNGDFDEEYYIDNGVIARKADGSEIENEDIEIVIKSNNTVVNSIDISQIKQYKVTYSIQSGGVSLSVIRTIIVRDTTPPVITHNGNATINVSQVANFDPYEGVSVFDNSMQEVGINISTNLSSIPGVYTITYIAEDTSGNISQAKKIVTVVE